MTAPIVSAPAQSFISTEGVAFGGLGEQAQMVTQANGLPVRLAADQGPIQTTGGPDEASVGEYADGAGVRVAVTASSAAHALPVLSASRRVRVCGSVRAFLRFGGAGVSASLAGTSIPFVADTPETVKVPAGATHFAVIRDAAADGHIHLQPVVG